MRAYIPSILIAGAGLLLLTGCKPGEAVEQNVSDGHVNQAMLDAMSNACHAPREWLTYHGGEEVLFQPSPDANFDTVDCLLGKLRDSIVPMKLGFVGNERYGDEQDENAQKN